MEYPKEYTECPLCHCTERVVEEEIKKAKEAGLVDESRVSVSKQMFIPIKDPMRTAFAYDVLVLFWDICSNCSFEYIHVIDKQRITDDQYTKMMGGLPFGGKG